MQVELEGALEVISDPTKYSTHSGPLISTSVPPIRSNHVDIVASQTKTAAGETMSRPSTTRIGERTIDPASQTFTIKANSAETVLLRDYHIGTWPITPVYERMWQFVN